MEKKVEIMFLYTHSTKSHGFKTALNRNPLLSQKKCPLLSQFPPQDVCKKCIHKPFVVNSVKTTTKHWFIVAVKA